MSLRLRRHVATLGVMTVALAAGALAAAHPLGADPPVPSAAAAAAVAPVAGGADDIPPPAQDAFYQAPSPLPAGEPGTIIRSRPVTVRSGFAGVDYQPVLAWQVLYRSTSALGEPVAVSGTVIVPDRPWGDGPRPLVTYAVGTHGLGDQCAPSYELRTGAEGERGLLGQALQRGWAVVVTDYEGLGTPGTHTYAVGVAEGHAVLDAAWAAQRLPEAGLAADGPVGIWGYSQGGQAASWAGELAPAYAAELQVAGVAAGGVPADLVAVTRNVDGGPAAGLVVAGAVGYDSAYPELGLASLLNAEGKAAAAQVAASCTEEIVAQHPFRRMADYTTVADPLAEPRFAARLAENRAGTRAPGAPVLVYHGTADELIPVGIGRQLADDYCRLGAAVRWQELPLLGHVQAAMAGAPVAVSWL
ncbi:MAG TPA: lipase family protein, partial [Acidimicrobiia bacterium]|nr:lipase family protein [Acidimicrobiia bacterium]